MKRSNALIEPFRSLIRRQFRLAVDVDRFHASRRGQLDRNVRRPAARQARKPPITSVARDKPRSWRAAAARLDV